MAPNIRVVPDRYGFSSKLPLGIERQTKKRELFEITTMSWWGFFLLMSKTH